MKNGNPWKAENGMVIVEATIVFPVMFIILFVLLYMGNAFFMKARIESIVERKAVEGANECADPLLGRMREGNGFPSLSELETEPYRYLFGGMGQVEADISKEVEEEILGQSASFFKNMSPDIRTSQSDIAQFHNYVVYSTFSVEVQYTIRFPIRFLGAASPPALTLSSRAEVPVNDTAEFIRNADMVVDLFHGTKLGQKISDVFGKVNDFISNFARK